MFLTQLAFALTDTQLKWIYEAIGIIASAFVLISFLFSNEKKTRIINIVGATVFVIYGILVKAYSTSIMNGALIIVHIVKLVQASKKAKNKQEKEIDDTERQDSNLQEENKSDKAEDTEEK